MCIAAAVRGIQTRPVRVRTEHGGVLMVIERSEPEGGLLFRVYLPHAEHVALVGDFTDWDKHSISMKRESGDAEGWWAADCRVPEGDHAFSYLVDGRYWMPDYAASGVHRNEYGRWTSNLSVPRAGRRMNDTVATLNT